MKNFRGKVLDDRYEFIDIIGVGGMANVYKAFDRVRDCYVAIKVLKKEYSKNQEFVNRFKNELKANASLSHPNIVRVFDVGFDDKIQYIVMEYIEGVTLKDFIKSSNFIGWKDVVHFTFQILRGLQHAHYKGIVHRDMKPQNIMLLEDGTVKIMDFGIARFPKDEKIDFKEAVGSVYYISPEQAMGGLTDAKSDIYSVGIIMYEMLTGKLPFEGKTPQYVARQQIDNMPVSPLDINPSLPKGLVDITLRAIKKRPQDRYQSADEMLLDLDEFKKNPNITFNYRYFDDIETTKNFGVSGNFNNRIIKEKKHVKKKGKLIPILFGTAGGIFLVAMVMVVIFMFGRKNNVAEEIEIPNFIGMNYEYVKTIDNGKYKDLGFIVKFVPNSRFAPGVIVDQSIKSGTIVKPNYGPIEISVATEEEVGRIPKIIGMNINKAKAAVSRAGFKNITEVEKYDEGAEVNAVVSVTPSTSSEISLDTPIKIYFNKEVTKNDVSEIPNLVGMSFEDAKSTLKSLGFEIVQKKVEQDDKPFGVVLEQSKIGKAEIGSKVEVVINEKVVKPEEKAEEKRAKINDIIEKTFNLPLLSRFKVTDTFKVDVYNSKTGKVIAGGDYKIGKNSSINIKLPFNAKPEKYIVNVQNLTTKKTAKYAEFIISPEHGSFWDFDDLAFYKTVLNNNSTISKSSINEAPFSSSASSKSSSSSSSSSASSTVASNINAN